jgi:hypothetical protein
MNSQASLDDGSWPGVDPSSEGSLLVTGPSNVISTVMVYHPLAGRLTYGTAYIGS